MLNLWKENHKTLKRTRDTAEEGTCCEERKGCRNCKLQPTFLDIFT